MGDGFCSVGVIPVIERPDVAAAVAVCGNRKREGGEECDDGNARDYDGCSADCLQERGFCGDGTVQRLLGEQCEPSVLDPALPLRCTNCRYVSLSCGNGTVEQGEECDDGDRNSDAPGGRCRRSCIVGRCGDAILDTVRGEQCDDGNRVGADGCSEACIIERAAPLSPLAAQVFDVPVRSFSSYPMYSYPVQLVQPQQAAVIGVYPPANPGTGPASLAVMAAGAAAGVGWARRKKR